MAKQNNTQLIVLRSFKANAVAVPVHLRIFGTVVATIGFAFLLWADLPFRGWILIVTKHLVAYMYM